MSEPDYSNSVWQQLIELASDEPALYESAHRWLLDQGPSVVPTLEKALADGRLGSVGHWRILLLLRDFGLQSSLPIILAALRRDDHIVKAAAMEALAAFSAPEATAALTGLFSDSDPDVVRHAASLLGQRRDALAIDQLVVLLNNSDPSLRYSAARALSDIGGPAVHRALRQHLADEDSSEVRELITSKIPE